MIRGFRFRDAANLSRLRTNELYLTELPVGCSPRNIMLSAFRSLIPMLGGRKRCYVLLDANRLCAVIEAGVRSNRDDWDIEYLGSAFSPITDEEHVTRHWHDLVEWVAWDAAAHMAKRLYARVPADTIETSVFMDQGFHAYSREYFYALRERPIITNLPDVFLRPQGRNDSWAIQQLFNATTPSMFRQVDPSTSKRWQLPSYFPNRQSKAYGFVAEDKSGLVTYIRCELISGVWLVRVLFRPESRAGLGALIGTVLAELETSRRSPIYIRLWDHQLDLRSELERIGANHTSTHTLLVKHVLGVIRVVDRQRLSAPNRAGQPVPTSSAGHGG